MTYYRVLRQPKCRRDEPRVLVSMHDTCKRAREFVRELRAMERAEHRGKLQNNYFIDKIIETEHDDQMDDRRLPAWHGWRSYAHAACVCMHAQTCVRTCIFAHAHQDKRSTT